MCVATGAVPRINHTDTSINDGEEKGGEQSQISEKSKAGRVPKTSN